jgi:single-strand DNA-binding protein
MNSLNSVLVEGSLIEDPIDGAFTIKCQRFFSRNNEKEEEVSLFKIETFGKQAQIVMKVLTKGRGIRVVGRLKQVGEGVVIIGETIEIKSQFDVKANHG